MNSPEPTPEEIAKSLVHQFMMGKHMATSSMALEFDIAAAIREAEQRGAKREREACAEAVRANWTDDWEWGNATDAAVHVIQERGRNTPPDVE